ncbi:MAG TPA: DUF5916 domain-containing protein [Bacteroidota bacterium]|nr:DUF5916 domain-containing protein [Bacteroidota bacterium]
MTHFRLITAACFILIHMAYSQTPPTAGISIPAIRITESITIDGVLSEQAWHRNGFTGLTQQEPNEYAAPSYRSEVWFAYDNEAIYFAAHYSDARPDSILARLVRRDFIWGDPSDGCVLYLDPYHDHRNGYFFYLSAAGTMADGIIHNDAKMPNDLSWDAVWAGATKITPDGWDIEMKIPYSQMRFREDDIQTWGVNVERYISRKNETSMIAFTPRNETGFASRFPQLTGIQDIRQPARFELVPYLTGRAERIGTDTHDPYNRMSRYLPGAGIDLKTALGSSLMLNATINPDFCQVESDPATLNLTDIETLYEEKRPFFTEGVGIFKFGQGGANSFPAYNWADPNIFYSRRIGRSPQASIYGNDPSSNYYVDAPNSTRILGAAKLSGGWGEDWKIGSLHALTNREKADINDNGRTSSAEIEPLTYYGVIRAQRDYNSGAQGVGFLTTYTHRLYDDAALRDYTNSDAVALAADGWTFLDAERTYVLTGWGAVSRIAGSADRMRIVQTGAGHYFQRPDASYLGVDTSAESMAGYAGRLALNKNRGRWTFNAALGVISPRFEINDLGSSAFSDIINMHVNTAYRWNVPTSYYQSISTALAIARGYDFGGNNTFNAIFWNGSWTFPDYSGIALSYRYWPESYSGRLTRGGPLTLNPSAQQAAVSVFTDNRVWWVLNFSAFTKSGDGGKTESAALSLELKAATTLTLSLSPSWTKDRIAAQYFTSVADPSASATYGRRYVFSHLDRSTVATEVRADWILTPQLSFQVYVQPYITTGKYTDYKSLSAPKTFSFDPFSYRGNRDFAYTSLQGNAVLRWEYRPGSTLYFVWTQTREDYDFTANDALGTSVDRMFGVKPDNIFMLKFSYWLGM